MTQQSKDPKNPNRRDFIKQGGSIAVGATVLAGLATDVSAGEPEDPNTIRLALIGCGGRGSGAVRDALEVKNVGAVKLYAMADLIDTKLDRAYTNLKKMYPDKVDVSTSRKFLGFDAYKKAIDILRPGDIALCTTRAYIRPVHVEYAVSKGVNVFMEKPFAPDPAGLHRMLRTGEEADKKGVKISAGLQCRHSPARIAMIEKIRNGELGDINLIRANRLGSAHWLKDMGSAANSFTEQLQFGRSQLMWVGSGHMVDNLIHQIDECCWIKDAWPVECNGLGGRVPRSEDHGQNLDIYSMEFTYADGSKAFCGFRRMNKCRGDFATYLHGTRKAGQFSGQTHAATVHMFKDQVINRGNVEWTPTDDAVSPWQYEWNDFLAAIRGNQPYNETKRAVYSDFASIMGRAACHTGQIVTWDEIMESNFAFCDYLDELNYGSPAPAKVDEQGRFDVPVPGFWKEV
jgi:predicted dehydrogenase